MASKYNVITISYIYENVKTGDEDMKATEVIRKANSGEGLTVEEIKIYNANVKPQKHVYGKYGTLAKRYIEEHNFGKLLSLAGHLPEYLHGVDKAAEELYDVLWDKLSKNEGYCRTGNYLEDVKRINAMKQVIEEEILNEIVYV